MGVAVVKGHDGELVTMWNARGEGGGEAFDDGLGVDVVVDDDGEREDGRAVEGRRVHDGGVGLDDLGDGADDLADGAFEVGWQGLGGPADAWFLGAEKVGHERLLLR